MMASHLSPVGIFLSSLIPSTFGKDRSSKELLHFQSLPLELQFITALFCILLYILYALSGVGLEVGIWKLLEWMTKLGCS